MKAPEFQDVSVANELSVSQEIVSVVKA